MHPDAHRFHGLFNQTGGDPILSPEDIALALQAIVNNNTGSTAAENQPEEQSNTGCAPAEARNTRSFPRRHNAITGATPAYSDSLSTIYDQLQSGAQKNRQTQRTKKLNEYFRECHITEGKSSKVRFSCRQCSFVIYAIKPRERIFHIILCRQIPYKTRMGYYMTCNDKNKPPLLPLPRPGITASEARREAIMKQANTTSRHNLQLLAEDPRRNTFFYRHMLQMQKRRNVNIGDCSEEETETATKMLMEFIIQENISFAVCDRRDGFPRPLGTLLEYLRPGFKVPRGHFFRRSLLDDYYETVKADVRSTISDMLLDGRATLMFDGSEDINSAPMVNLLLRVGGLDHLSTTTFFLTTIYTGYDTLDSKYYVDMAEKVVGQFFGFEGIAGIMTDNTDSVKNAREALEKKHPRVVASQDQAHVADRLIHDLGEIKWISKVLEKLTAISSTLRRFRKLRSRLMELMKVYNLSLTNPDTEEYTEQGSEDATAEQGSTQQATRGREPNSEANIYSHNDALCRIPFIQSTAVVGSSPASSPECREGITPDANAEISTEDDATGNTVSRPRTAVTLKKLSEVRFASNERILDEYIRTRPVLLHLVNDAHFEDLYTARNDKERAKRRLFACPIRDDEFLCSVRRVHAIFKACRCYLRVFDCETSIASEVYEATEILEATLKKLPKEFFPEPSEKTQDELFAIFDNRKHGPLPGHKRIKIPLLSDLHIAEALMDPYRTPRGVSQHMEAFRRHLERYMSGVDLKKELGLNEEDRRRFMMP